MDRIPVTQSGPTAYRKRTFVGVFLQAYLSIRRVPIAASAPFYGLIPWETAKPDWSKVAAKIEGHYAADDHFFTPEAAEALQTELRSLGKDATLLVYPEVDHAFFNDTRPEVYDERAATTAWLRVLDLFRTEL